MTSDLDIDGRERLFDEARELIHVEYGLADDAIGRSEVDRILADLKLPAGQEAGRG